MFDYVYEYKNAIELNLPEGLDIPGIESITKVSSLAWDEHCLECSAPECYNTCSLFENSRYNKCKRTAYGIRRVYYNYDGLYNYGIQLKYRKWGKLRCNYSNNLIYDAREFKSYYNSYERRRNFLQMLSKPFNLIGAIPKDLLPRVVHHRLMKAHKYNYNNNSEQLDGILLSCYSHLDYNFSMIMDSLKNEGIISRFSLSIKPGMNNFFVTLSQLKVSYDNITALEIYPENNIEAELTIFWLDLVSVNKNSSYFKEHNSLFAALEPSPKVKCLVWDLDNTLWEGTFVEDGKENLRLRQSAVDVIKKLDERGILFSIVSKNDFDKVWPLIESYGLDEYFLYPQINWMPKSENLKKIAKNLNINIDTFAFIDDSSMERNEITAFLPSVRVYDETQISNLQTYNEFNVIVTADSQKRRMFYRNEMNRKNEKNKYEISDFSAFIKQCEFVVTLFKPQTEDEVNRCLELIQRTNQLNASSRRLSQTELQIILEDSNQNVLAMKCKDKFGEYGTVGCLIIQDTENAILITDFVMSCRVSAKKIENALIKELISMYSRGYKKKIVSVKFMPTERNQVLRKVFEDMGAIYDAQAQVLNIEESKILDYDLIAIKSE